MVLQSGTAAGVWPARAIHDTVAAVMRQRAYQRSLRESLLERFFRWTGDLLTRIFRAAGHVPHGRYIALGLIAFIALLVLARVFYAARLRDEGARARVPRVRPRATASAPWDEAQQLAAEERYADAAHSLYRALLHMLAVRERLRLHDSKTTGDYARELRLRGSPYYTPFRQFGRRYDHVLFGTAVIDAAAYEQLLRDARPMLEAERAA